MSLGWAGILTNRDAAPGQLTFWRCVINYPHTVQIDYNGTSMSNHSYIALHVGICHMTTFGMNLNEISILHALLR
jgi:hypothetical protein